MMYPAYIQVGNDKEAHGVVFPDFPGCFSASDSWDGIPAAIQEAVEAHFHGEPETIPAPSSIENWLNHPEYQGGVWMLVDIDLSRIDTSPVRLNISLPSNLVREIDEWADSHHMTRSGFLALAARKAMET